VWAASGRTCAGHRTCPSAHARYPLTVTVIAGNIHGVSAGAYDYHPDRHLLLLVVGGDHRVAVACTTLADRGWLGSAAALLLLSADRDAANEPFADQPGPGRGQRYVWLEAGHTGQNVYLRASEAGLGAVLVAGFDDDRLLDLTPAIVPSRHQPLALLWVAHPADPRGTPFSLLKVRHI
jgi:SagB-type dehydrogenase family enzyme